MNIYLLIIIFNFFIYFLFIATDISQISLASPSQTSSKSFGEESSPDFFYRLSGSHHTPNIAIDILTPSSSSSSKKGSLSLSNQSTPRTNISPSNQSMSKLPSAPQQQPFDYYSYYIPTITNFSRNAGAENTVFSLYITFNQQFPGQDLSTLSKILSVSFGNYRISEPTVLPDPNTGPSSYSVSVKAPNFGFTGVNQLPEPSVPVSLIVSPQDPSKSPKSLYVCQFIYEQLQPPPQPQIFVKKEVQSSTSLSDTHSNSSSTTIVPNQQPSGAVDPRVVSPELSLSGGLVINHPQDQSNIIDYYNQPQATAHTQQPSTDPQLLNRQEIKPPLESNINQNQNLPPPQQNTMTSNFQPPASTTTSYQSHQRAISASSTSAGGSTSSGVAPNSMSPLDSNYAQVPSHYHHQTSSSTSSTSSYVDPNYARAPVAQHQVYYHGSSYYPQQQQPQQQPQTQQQPGYELNASSYDNTGSAVPEFAGWNLNGVPSASNMGLQGGYYQPRVLSNQSQLNINDSRALMAASTSQMPPPHPHMNMQPTPMMYGQFDPSSSTPQLVRTTALSQATMSLGLGGIAHDPLMNESAKASLDIIGNLDHMTQNWTEQERQAKRRLVQFKRTQHGSIVSVQFFPLPADKYTQNTPCISCIYWEEQNEHYVTSVDCIYLLEQLINNKFTVEEKNRIRRNLEGCHPMTVSKGKQNSGEFFKLIMSFSSPKPRNIEKDVKVFLWSKLGKALQKIVGKYSADYGGHAANFGYGNSGSYHTAHQIIPIPHTIHLPPQVQLQQAQAQAQAQAQQPPNHTPSASSPTLQSQQQQQQEYLRLQPNTYTQHQPQPQFPPGGGYR